MSYFSMEIAIGHALFHINFCIFLCHSHLHHLPPCPFQRGLYFYHILLDHLLICGELKFKKLIFIGAVGALKEGIELGDLCTPSYSVAGVFANAYLCEKLSDYKPFGKVYPDESYIDEVIALAKDNGYELKKASVYCTDSIALEYSHLEEIRAFDTDLIEMETSTFYEVAKLFEVPAVALLAVSDNSATGIPLIGRDEEQMKKYKVGRNVISPDLIYKIAKEK